MTNAEMSLVISLGSVLLAGLSLGWNIYRDVVRKARLQVHFSVMTPLGPAGLGPREILITAVNVGKDPVNCLMVRVAKRGLGRLLGKHKNAIVYAQGVPQMLGPAERLQLRLPFESDCFLNDGELTQLGIIDSYGKTHWAPGDDFTSGRDEYLAKFGTPEVSWTEEGEARSED